MSTFNAEIYIGNRGNTILSFDLYLGTGVTQNYNCSPDSGVTFNTFIHSGTTRVYQDVQWNDMYSGQTLFVDNIPMGTTHIKVVANRLSGVCNNLQPQIICIEGRPTPTPTPSPTPTSTPTPTPTSSPTSTPTPTPTPTNTVLTPTPTTSPTPTPTTSPTPTPTTNIDIDPSYFYYAMGDCSDMRYSYTASTITGFSPPIQVPGCDTLANIGILSMQNPATTSYYLSNPLVACGFGTGYTSSIIARSSTSIANETVFNIGGQCLAVIAVDVQYVSGTTIDLSGVTPIGIGWNACNSCSPPFTGFTITGYSGVTCDGENVLAYSLLGGFTLGNVYGIQMFSGGTAQGDAICMTLNANLGPQFVIEDPETEGISGYQITDAGPGASQIPVSYSGYSDCNSCEGIVVDNGKYQINGERCDDPQYSITIWSDTAPTVVSGNTFQVDYTPLSGYCWRVTLANQFKSSVVNDLGYAIVSTGCDCNGDNGGGNINVDNILVSITNQLDTGSECQSPQSQFYNETTITEIELTFRDSNNNSVTPNDTVEYRVGGSWIPITVTSSTYTLPVTLIYGDNSACDGGGTYADVLEVKVGTVTVLTYTAGQS